MLRTRLALRAVPEVPVPLAYKDRVYTVTNGGIVSVYDEASGKQVYRSRLGAGGLYYASPVAPAVTSILLQPTTISLSRFSPRRR